MAFYLHALSNETLQLFIVCFKSFLILLRFSVSSVFDMKTDISPLVCLFWERCEAEARLMARFVSASNQMKSLLLALSWLSHSRCPLFAILCCLAV